MLAGWIGGCWGGVAMHVLLWHHTVWAVRHRTSRLLVAILRHGVIDWLAGWLAGGQWGWGRQTDRLIG